MDDLYSEDKWQELNDTAAKKRAEEGYLAMKAKGKEILRLVKEKRLKSPVIDSQSYSIPKANTHRENKGGKK